MPKLALLVLALVASLITPAMADDWIAQKLRGTVLELVDGDWQPVGRGDAVAETHVVRTMGNARVLFQHGTETVELGPDTQVQFFRRASDGFTTVKEYFGEVTVEADIEKVKHFAVQAPQLVAVVKGTIFTVRSDDKGASVEVKRGAVGVTATSDHSSVTVKAGQQASTSDSGTLEVSGSGVLPTVVDSKGKAVTAATASDDKGKSNGKGSSGDNNGKSGKDKSGKDESGDGNSGSGNDDKDDSGSGNSGNGNSGHGSDNSGSGSGSGNSGSGSDNSGHGNSDDDEGDDD